MNQANFLRYAYNLGLGQSISETDLEKVAGVGSFLSKILPWFGKGTAAAGKAAPAASAAAKKPGILGHAGSLFGFGGEGTLGHTLSKPLSRIPGMGTTGGHQALGFGTFGGTLGALTAEEGDRLSAFGKGFGLGTIGGVGWRWGQKGGESLMRGFAGTGKGKGFRGALRRVTSKPTADSLTGKMGPDLQGLGKIYGSKLGPLESAKLMGARGVFGVGGLGAGIAASGYIEGKAEKHIPALRHSVSLGTRQALKAPFAAIQMGRRRLGLTPGRTTGSSSGTYSGTSSGAY